MPHCDPDTLALRALGEAVPDADEAHLATCATCRDTLEQLRFVAVTARQATVEGPLQNPPATVWTGIADELELADRTQPGSDAVSAATAPAPSTTDEVDRQRRRRASRAGIAWVAVAAGIIGLLGGVVGTAVVRRDNPGPVLATAALEPVGVGDAHGTASLHQSGGVKTLEVDLSDLPDGQGYFEVWLMNADNGGAVSLGSMDPDQPTTFTVPPALQLTDFPYVDVSLEPLDGDPAHSSDSVARGLLVS